MQDEYDFNKLDTDMEISVGMMSPVAFGSLNLKDLISEYDNSGFISTDPDGLLMISYEDSLFSFIAEDLLQIPDQSLLEFFIESPISIPSGFGTGDTISFDDDQVFPFIFENDERLDSIIFDQGSFIFEVNSEFQHEGTIQISCPTIRKDDVSFFETIEINDPSGTFTANPVFDLAGYTVYLSDSVGVDTFSYLPLYIHVELINSGAGVNIGESIGISSRIENLNFDSFFGYIGDYELLSQSGDLDLGFFENTLGGTIRFENPIIKFNIGNSYGVPAAVQISKFTGYNSTGDSLQMDFYGGAETFAYAYPTLDDYINSNSYKEKTITIDSTNSNVADFLAFLPSRLKYDVKALANPPGSDSSNFVTDQSKIDIGFEFVLPLWFEAENFAMEDTIELDLINIDEDADFIEKVSVMLEVSNGLPLDINMQLYFLDSLYNPVDSLFTGDGLTISSGEIDNSTNKVISPGIARSYIEYTQEKISALNTVRYGIIHAGLKTSSDENDELIAVKFLTDYSIEFNLSVGVDIKANPNDF